MSASYSQRQSGKSPKIRSDGWTGERQLRFLDALARIRSVSRAAAFAGMSRESAYRLRSRREGALFAAIWDDLMQPDAYVESHNAGFSDGRIARILGTHFRRTNGGFLAIGSSAAREQRGDRTGSL